MDVWCEEFSVNVFAQFIFPKIGVNGLFPSSSITNDKVLDLIAITLTREWLLMMLSKCSDWFVKHF